MRHRITLCLLLLLPFAAMPADAQVVQGATYDLFHDIALDSMDPNTQCSGPSVEGTAYSDGIITHDAPADAIHFEEGSFQPAPGVPVAEPPETRTACAMARFHFDVPAGTDHIHVRFDADRRVNQDVTLDVNMIQRMLILDADGAVLFAEDVFQPHEGHRDRTRIANLGEDDTDLIPIPLSTQRLSLVFHFQDAGREIQGNPSLLSGQAFEAAIYDPWIEFSGHPVAQGALEVDESRSGDRQESIHRVPVDVNASLLEPFAPSVRIRVAPDLILDHIETPDGQRLERFGSYRTGEEYSPSLDEIKLEPRDTFLRITLPGDMIRLHGAGEYVFVFVETTTLEPSPALFGVNLLLLAVPLVFAVLAFRGARAFQKEAFGQYAQTAKHLMIALVFVAVYYLAVVATAAVAGWLSLMATWPLGSESILLYLQVAIAVAAFVSLYRAGHAMLRIVKPAAMETA